MTRNHRKFHTLFWLVAAPVLIGLIVVNMPTNQGLPSVGNAVPAAAKIAVLPNAENLQ